MSQIGKKTIIYIPRNIFMYTIVFFYEGMIGWKGEKMKSKMGLFIGDVEIGDKCIMTQQHCM
jgi:hypothetical protein